MEDFNENFTHLSVIINYYDQFCHNNETKYDVTETFQNKSVLSSPTDSMDVIGRYIAVLGVTILSLLTLGGNLVIILSVTKSINLSSKNYSVYIVSLAFADFCVGLLVMPLMVTYTYYGYWPLGNISCTLFIIIDYGVSITSQVHLSAIAYDRLQSVSHPLKYRSSFTRGRATKVCICLWVGTFLFWTPGVLVTRVLKTVDETMVLDQCYYQPNKYYALTSVLIYCLLTDTLMITLSIMLVRVLRMRQIPAIDTKFVEPRSVSTVKHTATQPMPTALTRTKDADSDGILNTKTSTCQVNTVPPKELSKISDQNRRVIRTLVILITIYTFCLAPWTVFFPILAFCNSCIPKSAYEVAYWMSYTNSFVNPYLYLSLNSDFRAAFRQVFCHNPYGSANCHTTVAT